MTLKVFNPESETVVDEAMRIVRGNREGVYGPPDQNFRTIAAMWSAWLSVRLRTEVKLNGSDVCFLMQQMKLARLANSPTHRDSLVDIVGYADCADVCQRAAAAAESSLGPTEYIADPLQEK